MMKTENCRKVSRRCDAMPSPADERLFLHFSCSSRTASLSLSIMGLLLALMLSGCTTTGADMGSQHRASPQINERTQEPQFVEFTLPNGDTFEGYIVNGLLQGTGKHTWPNGDVYEGEFKQDRIDGEGKFTFVDGRSFEGSLKQGMFHGMGIYIYADGTKYTGSFKDNKLHGQGRLQYPSGDTYVGQFENDTMHGKGTYRTRDGTKLTGIFVDGEYSGE